MSPFGPVSQGDDHALLDDRGRAGRSPEGGGQPSDTSAMRGLNLSSVAAGRRHRSG